MSSPLALYDPLDIIGNGSFGIIRKVRRKSDGMVFARKELNFERMTERDRKQIVAEVNILKDLHHEHIVRYHDRYVDRDAGILYILMEYCGGGDLSTVIKQAQRHGRPIPEDTVWNYFMQILLALNHCHNPHSHPSGRTSASSEERDRRPQILHRDLKPDNVFLDESNTVKLGDFGLSKALSSHTFFAQTYVGTPYYMSPELMQEKSYDSKSDIWSLGCLIYELCALKPPFHEAKTHAELSVMIRNGRIPPLPKGYSPALGSVIKAMLNLNPAMRPSAQQLLQHERLDLAFKVAETEKMLMTVKSHKASVLAREREIAAREAALAERESRIASLTAAVSERDKELESLRALLATAETKHQQKVREALMKREEELRAMVVKHEAEVAERMARREEEIMEAVRKREEEIGRMWSEWERETREGMCKAVEERMEWVRQRTEELEKEREEIEGMRAEWERRVEEEEAELAGSGSARRDKTSYQPLEEVKNLMAPLRFSTSDEDAFVHQHKTPMRNSGKSRGQQHPSPVFETPISRAEGAMVEMPSAMKGVILTSTGESLATPAPATTGVVDEFSRLFEETPRVSLNFAKIFDFDSEGESEGSVSVVDGYEPRVGAGAGSLVASLSSSSSTSTSSSLGSTVRGYSSRSGSTRLTSEDEREGEDEDDHDGESTPKQASRTRTKMRRPSIVRAPSRASLDGRQSSAAPLPPSMSASTSVAAMKRTAVAVVAKTKSKTKEVERPARPLSRTQRSNPAVSSRTTTTASAYSHHQTHRHQASTGGGAAAYDLSDEENLPSPFLKRVDRDRLTRTASVPVGVLPSSRSMENLRSVEGARGQAVVGGRTATTTLTTRKSGTLRAQAVVNAANAVGGHVSSSKSTGTVGRGAGVVRTQSASAVVHLGGGEKRSSVVVKAQRASEEARRALAR